ncbi:hypothetical protein ACIPUA_04885 [Providencia sp. AGC89]
MVLAKVLQGKKNNTSEQTQSKTNNNPEISKVIPENFTSKITEHNTQLVVLNAKKPEYQVLISKMPSWNLLK